MSSKSRKEIERLVEALDEEPIAGDEGGDAVKRLGIDVKAWAASIETRIASAEREELQARIARAASGLADETRRLDATAAGPTDPALQDQVWQHLVARLRPDQRPSFHAHKFEKATAEEKAEMIRALRHLLDEDDEET